jgi:hypothetical protein
MSNEKYFEIALPKWPRLLVVGDKVTREQAMEILIRTDDLEFSGNDNLFMRQLSKVVYGIDTDTSWHIADAMQKQLGLTWEESRNKINKTRSEYRILENLYYLQNRQIVSAWVGGPHGWCDWEGNIYTAQYNIGKWPDVATVYNEWCDIASTFPFLKLTAQLLSREIGDSDPGVPVVQFNVANGVVTMSVPERQITPATMPDFVSRFASTHGERGCTIEQFYEASTFVKNKYSTK